ncbi:hypothetical protein T484DRAFT_3631035, partial [Baffinella frigidus]
GFRFQGLGFRVQGLGLGRASGPRQSTLSICSDKEWSHRGRAYRGEHQYRQGENHVQWTQPSPHNHFRLKTSQKQTNTEKTHTPKKAAAHTPLCLTSGCRVQGSGFRVSGFGFRVLGVRFRVQSLGFRVQGSGFRVQGLGFRVQGSGFRV